MPVVALPDNVCAITERVRASVLCVTYVSTGLPLEPNV